MQKALWIQNIWKGANEAGKKGPNGKWNRVTNVPASCCGMREIKLDSIIEKPTFRCGFPLDIVACCPWANSHCFFLLHHSQHSGNSLGTALSTSGPWACPLFLSNTHFPHGSLTSLFSLLFTSAHILDSSYAFAWVSVICTFPYISHYFPLNRIHPLEWWCFFQYFYYLCASCHLPAPWWLLWSFLIIK